MHSSYVFENFRYRIVYRHCLTGQLFPTVQQLRHIHNCLVFDKLHLILSSHPAKLGSIQQTRNSPRFLSHPLGGRCGPLKKTSLHWAEHGDLTELGNI